MQQCSNALVITQQMNIREVLNNLSKTKFNGQRAVQSESSKDQFCIDNGMNNVRAIINSNKTHIRFFCRYTYYVDIVDSILEAFAAEQSLVIESRENSPTN